MRYRILFPSDAFGLVGIDVPKVGAVVHQHIVGDEIGREISAFRATGIVRVCQWIKYFGEDAATFERFVDFGTLDRESKECIPDGIKRLLGRRLKESVENRRKAAVVKNFFNIDRQERQGIPFPQCNVRQNIDLFDPVVIFALSFLFATIV